MKLDDIHNVYFLGIGGIGMSALARWFLLQGRQVSGYDRTPTALTKQLEAEGMRIHFEDEVARIPAQVMEGQAHTLVIYTPAIPKGHKEFEYLQQEGFTIKKRAEVLGLITHAYYTIAVAGTHGKTTTSSMIAHLLKASGRACSAFLGGIATNYNSNLIWHSGEEKPVVVVEADEFDRSFLWLKPNIAVLTATDADHLDIYGKHESLLQSFQEFLQRVNPEGDIFLSQRAASAELLEVAEQQANPQTYAAGASADCRAENIRIEEGRFVFDYLGLGAAIKDLSMPMPGFHNVENAVAAISVGLQLNLTEEQLRTALASYRGVKRRFEYVLDRPNIKFIDDYAHHPEEISAFLKSVRALYPTKKITVIFQPHLFTRTRDFAEGFSASLSLADEVILTEIYPARELPIAGVSSEMVFENIQSSEKELIEMVHLPDRIREGAFEVVLTVGAGDIDKQIPLIKELLEEKYEG